MHKGWLLPLIAGTALACNAILGIDGDVIGPNDAGSAAVDASPTDDAGSPDGTASSFAIAPIQGLKVVQGSDVELDVLVTGPGTNVVAIAFTPPAGISIVSQTDPPELGKPTHFKLHADTFAPRGVKTLTFRALVKDTVTRDAQVEVTGPFDETFGDGGIALLPFKASPSTGNAGLVSSDVGIAVTDAGIVVGFSTNDGSGEKLALARLTQDGKSDPSFPGFETFLPPGFSDATSAHAHVVTEMADGGLLVLGEMRPKGTTNNTSSHVGVVWPTDAGFATDSGGPNSALRSADTLGDAVYAVGAGSSGSSQLVRIQGGELDPSFGGASGVEVRGKSQKVTGFDVKVGADRSIFVVGSTGGLSPSNGSSAAVLRFFEDGGVDTSFGDAGTARVNDYPAYGFGGEVLADGGILVLGARAGALNGSDPTGQVGCVTRFLPSGAIDLSYGGAGSGRFDWPQPSGASRFYGASVLDDGSLLLLGAATSTTVTPPLLANALVKISADGQLVSSFGIDGVARVPLSTASHFRRAVRQGTKRIAVGLFWEPGAPGKLSVFLVRIDP